MPVIVPTVPTKYDSLWFSQFFSRLVRAVDACRQEGADIEVGSARLILRSPDGTRYQITVNDAGTLSTSVVT